MPKKPKPRATPGAGNIGPRVAQPSSKDGETPIFCLKHLIKGFHLSDCDRAQKEDFVDRLVLLSKVTWGEILVAGRKGFGTHQIPRASIRSVPSTIPQDAVILSLRMNERGRLVGFREEAIFHIMWVDPLHKLYKG